MFLYVRPEPSVQSSPPRRWLRRTVITVVTVLVLVVALLAGVYFGQRALLYFPDTTDPGSVEGQTPGAVDVSFTTADGLTLHTWMFGPTTQPRNMAVLFCPGNAGSRANRFSIGTELAALGYTVLLLEYRGFGGNPGKPTEDGIMLDAQAAVGYLHSQGFASNRLIYAGESLGTGVAVHLATIDQPAAMLLRSPYTSMVDMARALYPWLPVNLLLRDRYETMRYLPSVTVPITVLAGSADELVPLSQSQAVADAAPNLFQFNVVDGAGHNDPVWSGPYLAAQVDALAKHVYPTPPG